MLWTLRLPYKMSQQLLRPSFSFQLVAIVSLSAQSLQRPIQQARPGIRHELAVPLGPTVYILLSLGGLHLVAFLFVTINEGRKAASG